MNTGGMEIVKRAQTMCDKYEEEMFQRFISQCPTMHNGCNPDDLRGTFTTALVTGISMGILDERKRGSSYAKN